MGFASPENPHGLAIKSNAEHSCIENWPMVPHSIIMYLSVVSCVLQELAISGFSPSLIYSDYPTGKKIIMGGFIPAFFQKVVKKTTILVSLHLLNKCLIFFVLNWSFLHP